MVDYTYKVTDFISKLPAYVDSSANLSNTLNKMLKFNLKEIPVIDKQTNIKNFISKRSLFKHVHDLDNLNIADILENEHTSIIAYPESDINEVYSIMTNLGLKCIPVVKSPWSKKLMGFVDIKRLEKEIKKMGITPPIQPQSQFL